MVEPMAWNEVNLEGSMRQWNAFISIVFGGATKQDRCESMLIGLIRNEHVRVVTWNDSSSM